MFYAYEATLKTLVIADNLNDVEENKCEAYDTVEDIPFHEYDYWLLPPSITKWEIDHRIKIDSPMELEKSKKGRTKESAASRLTPTENKYGVLTEG